MEVLNKFLKESKDPTVWQKYVQYQDNYLYTTNGIAICRRKPGIDDIESGTNATDVQLGNYFDKGRKIGEIQLKAFIDSLQAHKTTPIYGIKKVKCATCSGDGYLECDLDHKHTCIECDGEKTIDVVDSSVIIRHDFSEDDLIDFQMINDIRYCFDPLLFEKLSGSGDTAKVYLAKGTPNALVFKTDVYEFVLMRVQVDQNTTKRNFLSTINFMKK